MSYFQEAIWNYKAIQHYIIALTPYLLLPSWWSYKKCIPDSKLLDVYL